MKQNKCLPFPEYKLQVQVLIVCLLLGCISLQENIQETSSWLGSHYMAAMSNILTALKENLK